MLPVSSAVLIFSGLGRLDFARGKQSDKYVRAFHARIAILDLAPDFGFVVIVN
jgi:hypothetical protein